jgi:hypothetical protein
LLIVWLQLDVSGFRLVLGAALSLLIGLTLLDTVVAIDQLSTLSDDDLIALAEPAITRYLAPPSG